MLYYDTSESTHLCDVLHKVFAEWESAAYEPHGDHMVGQGHNVLVEPNRVLKTKQTNQRVSVRIWSLGMEHLLGRVSVGERDGKHTDILLSYKVGIQMRQAHQSYKKQTNINNSSSCRDYPTLNIQHRHTYCRNSIDSVCYSLERNSSIGDAMATVAEMWVSLTMREGRSLIMMSGISTVHIVRATTHCLAQR